MTTYLGVLRWIAASRTGEPDRRRVWARTGLDTGKSRTFPATLYSMGAASGSCGPGAAAEIR